MHKRLTTCEAASILALVSLIPRATLRDAIFRSGRLQREIARAAGISEADLSRIVRGRMNPTEDEQKAIAKALRQPIDRLFSEEESVAS